MFRDLDEKMITPDKLLSANDMARLSCNDCAGCSQCCRDRAYAIVLDAIDISLLKENLNYSFEGLLQEGYITLEITDGVILPRLCVKEGTDECVFLNEKGRCSIHPFRPGICRMFPLARIYHEDGSFSYFIQEGECSRASGAKIKVSKWLGYPNIKAYEKAVTKYHDHLVAIRTAVGETTDINEIAEMQKKFLYDEFVRGISI